ncbi:MAG: tetratricopeptide repeat protein, partial [Planctomycetales bacterium]
MLQNEGHFQEAAAAWEAFLKRFPDDPLADKARHHLGICLIQQKQYEQAAKELATVAAKPKFELLDATLFNPGLAYYSQAVETKDPKVFRIAESTYKRLADEFPNNKWIPEAIYYRAECLFALGQLKNAVTEYSQFLKSYPDHQLRSEALYALGVSQLELKQAEDAEGTFDRFLKAFPGHEMATRIQLHKADAQFEQAKFETAMKLYQAVAKEADFEMADVATMRQADCLTSLKRYGEAAALFASVPSKFPDSSQVSPAILAAGNRFYIAGDPKQAAQWLKKVQGDGEIEAAHWLARCYLQLGQPAEALVIVKRVLPGATNTSFYVDLLLDRADAIYDLPKRRAESIVLYQAIADQHPGHPQAAAARYYAAWSASNVGEHEIALQQARKFLQDYSEHDLDISVRSVLADSLLNSGALQDAETIYREIIKQSPRHEDVLRWQRLLAWSLYRQNKHADVIALLNPILDQIKEPKLRAEVLFLVGSSQFVSKNYQPAVAHLEGAYQAAPRGTHSDESLLLLSRAHRQLGDLQAAQATIRKMIREYRDSELVDRAYYQLGNFYYAAGNHVKAEQAFAWVLKKWPKSNVAPEAHYWLGWSRLNQDKYAQAVVSFGRVINDHGNHDLAGPAMYARAQARRLGGEYAEAKEDLAAFLKTNPNRTDRSNAHYERGLCEMELNQLVTATKTFQEILKDDPQYKSADQVRYQLGWSLKDQKGKQEAAIEVFTTLAAKHPKSQFAAEALTHVGEDQYANKAYRKAAETFQAALNKANRGGQLDLVEISGHKLAWC